MNNLTAQQRRQFRGLVTMGLFLLFASYTFYFNSDKNEPITFGFVVGNEWYRWHLCHQP
jgi:simple sugar transport system permease protein